MEKEIQERIGGEDWQLLILAEEVLMEGMRGKIEKEKVREVLRFWRELDANRFERELFALPLIEEHLEGEGLEGLREFFKKSPAQKALFQETERLLKILLLAPPSTAGVERSFSLLRRLKTWLRSSMSQERLTHLAVMACYPEVEKLKPEEIGKEFIRGSDSRRKVFGGFD